MVKEECTFKDKKFYFDPDVFMPDFQREMFHEEAQSMNDWWDIKEGETVVDCGAGTGSWALPAASMGANTIAFECDSARVFALKANVACNPGMQMVIDPRGLYSRECELGMDINSSSVMLQLGYQPQQRVKMTTLDKFYSDYTNLNRLDWFKIDVEGAELHVLSGATNTISKYKPKIIVEAHTHIIPGIDGLVLSFINRLAPTVFYKATSLLNQSKPGALDLRSYTYPRILFEPV